MITKAALQVGSWTRWWSTYHLLVSGQCSRVVAGWTKTRMMGNWRENCYLEQTLKRRIHHVRTHREWFCCHAVIGSNIFLYPLNQSELIIVLAVLLINQLICLPERKKIPQALFKTPGFLEANFNCFNNFSYFIFFIRDSFLLSYLLYCVQTF